MTGREEGPSDPKGQNLMGSCPGAAGKTTVIYGTRKIRSGQSPMAYPHVNPYCTDVQNAFAFFFSFR